MQRTLAVLLVLPLLALFTPGAIAAESVTEPYNGALGYQVPRTGTPVDDVSRRAFVVCPAKCDFNDPSVCANVPEVGRQCTPEVPTGGAVPVINPVGGTRLRVAGSYNNVIISPNDDVYGSGAGIATCFWNPDGDTTCSSQGDAPDYPSDTTCGTVTLVGSPFASNFVTAWIFTVVVMDDFDVCGGTVGTMTGDFF